jgi:hypothetical protein
MSAAINHSAQQLLLLVSRERLSPAQLARAAELAAGVDDWEAFVRVSHRAFGICLVHAGLSRLPPGSVPVAVLASLRQGARGMAARSLLIESTQRRFADDCLAPGGARHAFFKGLALSTRYYAAPAHRPCRDVDVLVDGAAVLDVVLRAHRHGYKPYEVAGVDSDRDVAAWVKYGSVFPMLAPSGVLVEIHKSLDHGEGFFDTAALLARAEAIELRGRPIAVLGTADLFTYLCMHHTRHFWSHLHWFSDLDALSSHAAFDPDEVRQVARKAGLLSTVEACLGLNRLAAGGRWTNAPGTGPEHALLESAIACLLGGREREDELRGTRLSSDRAFSWQLGPGGRLAHRLRKARPTFTDYQALPLPGWLQPLYYLTRPFRVLAMLASGKSPGSRAHPGAARGH